MLENSVFTQYIKDKTLAEVISNIYGCESFEIALEEQELYALIKRHLTKKELRFIFMSEAGLLKDEIISTVKIDEDKFDTFKHKAYQKIRSNKVQDSTKNTNAESK